MQELCDDLLSGLRPAKALLYGTQNARQLLQTFRRQLQESSWVRTIPSEPYAAAETSKDGRDILGLEVQSLLLACTS